MFSSERIKKLEDRVQLLMTRWDLDQRVLVSQQKKIDVLEACIVQHRAEARSEVNRVQHLVTNLARLFGYRPNEHTRDSIQPDMWTQHEKGQDRATVLESTGRLRDEGEL
jgi:hypothetical protein